MNCQNTTESVTTCSSCGYGRGENAFLIIVVLYILLAIILGCRCRGY